MAKMMKFIALAAVLCCFLPTMVTATIWGDWGPVEYCPNGERAIGFSLKTEAWQGDGDDTALNSISLKCSGGSWIESTEGPWGRWGRNFYCPLGSWLRSCQLRVEHDQGKGDDTAANNLNCICSNGRILEGDGTSWGSWRGFKTCQNGIVAIRTRVEVPQGSGDDTALNDVAFVCGTWIYSTQGSFGVWGRNSFCPTGSWLTSCQLRVEPKQGTGGDDSAANNLNCKCSKGIIGIQTRVEAYQGTGEEDTGLNDVKFTCWGKRE